MQKKINPYYVIKENENIELISKKCDINAISLLIKNQILPKDIKKGNVLIINDK